MAAEIQVRVGVVSTRNPAQRRSVELVGTSEKAWSLAISALAFQRRLILLPFRLGVDVTRLFQGMMQRETTRRPGPPS